MATIKDISTSRFEAYRVDPKLLQIEPGFNFRIDSPELTTADEELKNSIITNGVMQPLTIRMMDDKPFIVNGHRRHKAILAAIAEGHEIPTVPCIPEPKGTSEEDRVLMLITTNSGLAPTALEKGDIFKRLSQMGWSNERIGERAGISYKQVENLIALQSAPTAIKELISTGTVSATLAMKTIQSEGRGGAAVTLAQAAAEVKEAGGTKVTAKHLPSRDVPVAAVVTPPPATGGLASLLKIGQPPAQAAPAQAPEPPAPDYDANGNRFPRLLCTSQSFKEIQDCMREMLNVDDIKTIHIMVRDALKVERKPADKAA
jgi:ParB family chromosome partitioning protein